jgi:hypothetical protein
MPGTQVKLGPFNKGLHNSAGSGEYIDDAELFDLVNLEVDSDGSLANRPAISSFNMPTVGGRFKIIGYFNPTGSQQYLVLSYGTTFSTVGLFSLLTNTVVVSRALKSNVAVQYNNRIHIIPASDATPGTGGFYDGSATPAWTAVGSMPRGDDAIIFKDRLFITAGLAAPAASDSTLNYSCFLHPEVWVGDATPGVVKTNDASFVNIEKGNGQRLISVLIMGSDLVLCKEHSTFRISYGGTPSSGDLVKVSGTIGTPTLHCAVTYDNNNIYILHDTSVYEMYNYTFTKLSTNLSMTMVPDTDIYSDATYGLTLFRNRLFVRYYSKQYVYSLTIGKWSRWTTFKKFNNLYVVPSASGPDTAYAASVSITIPPYLFSILDDRVANIQSGESFNCSITTKTYDFDLSYSFKVMFWWGMTIATSGLCSGIVNVPNAAPNMTWAMLAQQYASWQDANTAGVVWAINPPISINTPAIPTERGPYARKFLKFNKKIRFRQLYFTVTTQCLPNTIGDACVRIYDISAFLKQKETVVAQTT